MSPIEVQLYEAMRKDGLSPEPQLCIQGYYVDFAFADVKVAVEADGAEFHSGDRHERDQERDLVLKRAGWTVKRFYGAAISHNATDCVNTIKQELDGRRKQVEARAREEEKERQAQRDAMLRPFRRIAGSLKRKTKGEGV
jgi:very-short-patch-repair endonuclease